MVIRLLFLLLFFIPLLSAAFQNTKAAEVEKKDFQWCTVVFSNDFEKRGSRVNRYESKWCDENGKNCDRKWDQITLEPTGLAFQYQVQCYTSKTSKKLLLRHDQSFKEGYQEKTHLLNTSKFKVNDWRQFRIPSDSCISSAGSNYFVVQRNGIRLYRGKPKRIKRTKCKWELLNDANLKRCQHTKFKDEERLEHCNKVINEETDDKMIGSAYFEMAYIYSDQEKSEKAIETYQLSLKHYPENPKTYNNIGAEYKEKKKYEKAIEYYSQAIAHDSMYALAFQNLAEIYEMQGKHDLVIETYTKLISINPNNNEAFAERASTYLLIKNYEKSIADYQKAASLTPKSSIYVRSLGEVQCLSGDYKAALASFDKALSIDEESDGAYYKRGKCHFNNGQTDLAIADYDKAISIYVDKNYFISRGEAYKKKNNRERAIRDYRSALYSDPDSKEGREGLKSLNTDPYAAERMLLEQRHFKIFAEIKDLNFIHEMNQKDLQVLKSVTKKYNLGNGDPEEGRKIAERIYNNIILLCNFSAELLYSTDEETELTGKESPSGDIVLDKMSKMPAFKNRSVQFGLDYQYKNNLVLMTTNWKQMKPVVNVILDEIDDEEDWF